MNTTASGARILSPVRFPASRKPSRKAQKPPDDGGDALVKKMLTERFPAFQMPPVPLKIWIHEEVEAFVHAAISPEVLTRRRQKACTRIFLRQWTRHPAYQAALVKGGSRYDLWRRPAGEVTRHEQVAAIKARAGRMSARNGCKRYSGKQKGSV